MLRTIKLIHTLVWVIMATAVFYVLYVGITGRKQWAVWLAIGLIAGEAVILLVNRWRCPLSDVAVRYTEDRSDNFDIYLPRWLAKHNKTIFTLIFLAGLLLILIRSVYTGWE